MQVSNAKEPSIVPQHQRRLQQLQTALPELQLASWPPPPELQLHPHLGLLHCPCLCSCLQLLQALQGFWV